MDTPSPGGGRIAAVRGHPLRRARLASVARRGADAAGRRAIDYRRVDLVAVVHRGVLRVLGFPGITVPALRLDGRRVQGTRAIAEALDALRPEPPLFPADPEDRRAVDEAEEWGDKVYQPVPRRLVWAALRRDRSTLASYLEGAKLGVPVPVAARVGAPVIRAAARAQPRDRRERAPRPGEPARADRPRRRAAARWGVIGGVAAERGRLPDRDLDGAARDARTTRARCSRAIPRWSTPQRVAPSYPGQTPKVFPEAWLQA